MIRRFCRLSLHALIVQATAISWEVVNGCASAWWDVGDPKAPALRS